jgi:hypothetical protein
MVPPFYVTLALAIKQRAKKRFACLNTLLSATGGPEIPPRRNIGMVRGPVRLPLCYCAIKSVTGSRETA